MGLDAATPPGLFERIRKMIQDEVGKLLRSGLLRSASIGEGGLTIRGGFLRAFAPSGGSPSLFVGRLLAAGSGSYIGTGVLVQQPDGTDIAVFRTAEGDFGGGSIMEIKDAGGGIVFATDAASGQGVARPYVPGLFYRQRYVDWTVATTSATFEGLWKAELTKQHPRLSVAVQASMDTSGETGEVRIMVNGVQLGTTQPVGFGLTIVRFGPEAIAGSHMETVTVEIQGRRAGAAGALKVEPLHMLGQQS